VPVKINDLNTVQPSIHSSAHIPSCVNGMLMKETPVALSLYLFPLRCHCSFLFVFSTLCTCQDNMDSFDLWKFAYWGTNIHICWCFACSYNFWFCSAQKAQEELGPFSLLWQSDDKMECMGQKAKPSLGVVISQRVTYWSSSWRLRAVWDQTGRDGFNKPFSGTVLPFCFAAKISCRGRI